MALSMMSSGVFMARSMAGHSRAVVTPSTTLMAPLTYTALATKRRNSVSSFAPKAWAMGMENPEQMPMLKPRIRKLMEPVEPTAARDAEPRYLPTIAVSTKLYSC